MTPKIKEICIVMIPVPLLFCFLYTPTIPISLLPYDPIILKNKEVFIVKLPYYPDLFFYPPTLPPSKKPMCL